MLRKLSRAISSANTAVSSGGGDGSDDVHVGTSDSTRKASRESLAFYRSGSFRKGSVGRRSTVGQAPSTARKRSKGRATDTDASAVSASDPALATPSTPSPIIDVPQNADVIVRLQDTASVDAFNAGTSAPHFTEVTCVDLSHCTGLGDGNAAVLAQQCARLTAINLRDCCRVTDAGVTAMAGACVSTTNTMSHSQMEPGFLSQQMLSMERHALHSRTAF